MRGEIKQLGERTRGLSLGVVALLWLTACGSPTPASDEPDTSEAPPGSATDAAVPAFEPDTIEAILHAGPGSGTDRFVRALGEISNDAGLTDAVWSYVNLEGSAGATSMARLLENEGATDIVGFCNSTWLSTTLTLGDPNISVFNLTPIALLVDEPSTITVAADSPYQELQDLVDAALAAPGELVQTSGSTGSFDDLAGRAIQEATGAEWGFLSTTDAGERMTALMRGDADFIVGGPGELTEQARAGDVRVIATLGPSPTPLFPDAPTLAEAGFDVVIPLAYRGVCGPPGMPEEAIGYYEQLFEQVTDEPAWLEYLESEAYTPHFADSEGYQAFLQEQGDLLTQWVDELES